MDLKGFAKHVDQGHKISRFSDVFKELREWKECLALIFKIKMPNGRVKTMRYNKDTPMEERINLVKEHILEQWEDYFQDYWLKESFSIGMPINHSKSILDRCATFILLANMRENDILSSYTINSINSNEVQSYHEDDEDDIENIQLKEEENILFTCTEIKEKEKKISRQYKKWKQTKTRKLHKLFSVPETKTYRLKPVKDKETKKTARNAFGQAIYDVEYVTIGGQKGIDRSKPYVSEWCIVDTDNVFQFNGVKYRIDESVKQYEVSTDNKCSMDRILCICVSGETQFFDMNIDGIDNKFIRQV